MRGVLQCVTRRWKVLGASGTLVEVTPGKDLSQKSSVAGAKVMVAILP